MSIWGVHVEKERLEAVGILRWQWPITNILFQHKYMHKFTRHRQIVELPPKLDWQGEPSARHRPWSSEESLHNAFRMSTESQQTVGGVHLRRSLEWWATWKWDRQPHLQGIPLPKNTATNNLPAPVAFRSSTPISSTSGDFPFVRRRVFC